MKILLPDFLEIQAVVKFEYKRYCIRVSNLQCDCSVAVYSPTGIMLEANPKERSLVFDGATFENVIRAKNFIDRLTE